MKTITSKEFREAVDLDPTWASKLIEPMRITDFCDMRESKITHLSPLLHFTPKDRNGESADFSFCKSLKIAEGRFAGFVNFFASSIEKIGDLTCGKDENGDSAYFQNCKSLRLAEGQFEGCVGFSESGIEKIGDLSCGKGEDGVSANFCNCRFLKTAEGSFTGSVNFSGSSIQKIGDLTCGKDNDGIRLDVNHCENLGRIPVSFSPKEVGANTELRGKLKADRLKESVKKHLQTMIVKI